ncbi:hypothetical protein AB0L88_24610 [Saccharopolyspora shandongensis]|uniref:SWIM zinc finger family protein n=1 Tax=Saccharopolyspora shandongensis TaxID=418495 RepID=UPI0034395706
MGYQDAVGSIAELPGGVVASVAGTDSYRVRLRDLGGRLGGDCSCPYGREGAFCKHCVAVGLRVLATAPREATPASGSDVRAFLETLDRLELVDLIWQQAQDDPVLYQRLRLQAATASAQPDVSVLQDQVDLLQVDWLDFDDEDDYASRANSVLDALRRLLPDHVLSAQRMLREVVTHVGAAASACEDSAGMVDDAADAAWGLYLEVCQAAPPDPAELGRWLAHFRLNSERPEVSLGEVVDLLGEAGLAAYKVGLDQARDRQRDPWRERFLREELVREAGDTDELVETLAEDLSHPHAYVRIAAVLREADRVDEAIDWLQRGLQSVDLRDGRGGGLVERLVEIYQAVGRDADAVELLETRFTDSPDERTYRQWRTAAKRVGQWPQLRERAHRILRERIESGSSFAAGTLARILLEEGDIDAAWQVVQLHHCDEPTRLAVADRRAETHPADVIDIYRPLVDTAIAVGNRDGYARAARLLTTLQGLHSRTGAGAAFRADVAGLKETHRRKRALLAILAEHGL